MDELDNIWEGIHHLIEDEVLLRRAELQMSNDDPVDLANRMYMNSTLLTQKILEHRNRVIAEARKKA